MKDMNVAKLTSVDLPLFNGIMSDLFPGVETPAIDNSKVSELCARPVCCALRGMHLCALHFVVSGTGVACSRLTKQQPADKFLRTRMNFIGTKLFLNSCTNPLQLLDAIDSVLREKQMQTVPHTRTKVVQLYETKNSRHSTMIVGATQSGKSASWHTLQAACSRLARDGDPNFNVVRVRRLGCLLEMRDGLLCECVHS